MFLLILGIALWIAAHVFKRFAPERRAAMGEKGKGPVAIGVSRPDLDDHRVSQRRFYRDLDPASLFNPCEQFVDGFGRGVVCNVPDWATPPPCLATFLFPAHALPEYSFRC